MIYIAWALSLPFSSACTASEESSTEEQEKGPSPQESVTYGSTCTKVQAIGANNIWALHDEIEIVAYAAFAEKVEELDIHNDHISAEQSQIILQYIKKKAHEILYQSGGYWKSRGIHLTQCQIRYVFQNVGKIVHDRDTKLTNAIYYTLSDMLLGLDDHNTMVKTILLTSWFKCNPVTDPRHQHLDNIKGKAHFYERMDTQLNFSLREQLARRKIFWDSYFPGTREGGDERADAFVRIHGIRHHIYDLKSTSTQKPLFSSEHLLRRLEEVIDTELLPPNIDHSMSVGTFLATYFPDEIAKRPPPSTLRPPNLASSGSHSSLSWR